MLKTLARACFAMFAVSALVLVAGLTATRPAQADGPLDFSRIGAIGDLSGVVPTPTAAAVAAPPRAPIEAPVAPAPAATADSRAPIVAPDAVPAGASSPATLKLPSAGSGGRGASEAPMLAVLLAIAGGACAGAARRLRVAPVEA